MTKEGNISVCTIPTVVTGLDWRTSSQVIRTSLKQIRLRWSSSITPVDIGTFQKLVMTWNQRSSMQSSSSWVHALQLKQKATGTSLLRIKKLSKCTMQWSANLIGHKHWFPYGLFFIVFMCFSRVLSMVFGIQQNILQMIEKSEIWVNSSGAGYRGQFLRFLWLCWTDFCKNGPRSLGFVECYEMFNTSSHFSKIFFLDPIGAGQSVGPNARYVFQIFRFSPVNFLARPYNHSHFLLFLTTL